MARSIREPTLVSVAFHLRAAIVAELRRAQDRARLEFAGSASAKRLSNITTRFISSSALSPITKFKPIDHRMSRLAAAPCRYFRSAQVAR